VNPRCLNGLRQNDDTLTLVNSRSVKPVAATEPPRGRHTVEIYRGHTRRQLSSTPFSVRGEHSLDEPPQVGTQPSPRHTLGRDEMVH
jgi:hypothetical protein